MAELSTLSVIVLAVGVSVFLIILLGFLVWVFMYDRRRPKSSRREQTAFQNQTLRPLPDQDRAIPNLQLADQRESAASGRSSGSGDYSRIENFNIGIPEELGEDRSSLHVSSKQSEPNTADYALGNRYISDAESGLTSFICSSTDGNFENNTESDKDVKPYPSKELFETYSQATNLSAATQCTRSTHVGNSETNAPVNGDSRNNLLATYSLANGGDSEEKHPSSGAVSMGDLTDNGQKVSQLLDGNACSPQTGQYDGNVTNRIMEPQRAEKNTPETKVTASTHEAHVKIGSGKSDIYSYAKEDQLFSEESRQAQQNLSENNRTVNHQNNQIEAENNASDDDYNLASPITPITASRSHDTNTIVKNEEVMGTDPKSGLYFVLEERNEYDNSVGMNLEDSDEEAIDPNQNAGLYFVLEKTTASENSVGD